VTVALEEAGAAFEGKTVVIAGAGGAARAAAFAAAFGGARQIVVLNRTPGRASELARDLGDCATLTGPLSDLPLWLHATDILINATPIGLHESDPPLTGLDGLRPGTVVCDLAYRPGGTALISRAKELGFVVVDGLTVLVHQGARSFTLWTGLEAPVDVMRAAAVSGN
jgi:shikimate dehydrogenase